MSRTIAMLAGVFTACLCVTSQTSGEVQLAGIFRDHAVLQRDVAVPIWGTGTPGSDVTVTFGDQIVKGTVSDEGKWRVTLKPMQTNAKGQELRVAQGDSTIAIGDVVVGEVWLAAGQSNMQYGVRGMLNRQPGAKEYVDAALAESNGPPVRFRRINEDADETLHNDLSDNNTWVIASNKTVGQFAAVAWVFAERLRSELTVPIGIIDVSWGGKPIEGFIPRTGFAKHKLLKTILELADKNKTPELANLPGGYIVRNKAGYPGSIYGARMHPIRGYAMRGFLWYQAESNCGRGEDPREYRVKQHAMVESWREAWGNDALPVYYVQLPNFRDEATGWIRMREEQRRALATPNTAMAVTIDTGSSDIHPPNKIDVGERLALIAMSRNYGKKVIDSGPMYDKHQVSGKRVRVSFKHADGLHIAFKEGLSAPQLIKTADVNGFELAGADGVWHNATAHIEGKTVIVECDQVTKPVEVRYLCTNTPDGGLLYNKAKLPASPFCSRLEWLPWEK